MNENQGNVEITLSHKQRSNWLKTDKYMTAIATLCAVNESNEYKYAHLRSYIRQFSACCLLLFLAQHIPYFHRALTNLI